jgi:ectoine hydroxylase-related dioxygenase (phytanoyl-CoA dioxygenase family)
MLTQAQIDEYHARGFLAVDNVLTPTEIQELRDVTDEFVDQSRAFTEHTDVFDLEPDHTAQAPKLRRLINPASNHEAYDRTLRHDKILDMVSQLVGTESVRTNGNKLNMKASGLGSPVEWHQDWAFYPHTNDDLLAVGVAIDDMTQQNGCLLVIPESHKDRVYDHHQDGRFIGAVTEPDFDDSNAEAIEIKAGGISIHHVRTLHGSMPNTSSSPRRLFLLMYCSGDSFSLTETPGQITDWEDYVRSFLRGGPSQDVRVEACPVRLPLPGPLKPGSIFENQTALKQSNIKTA